MRCVCFLKTGFFKGGGNRNKSDYKVHNQTSTGLAPLETYQKKKQANYQSRLPRDTNAEVTDNIVAEPPCFKHRHLPDLSYLKPSQILAHCCYFYFTFSAISPSLLFLIPFPPYLFPITSFHLQLDL